MAQGPEVCSWKAWVQLHKERLYSSVGHRQTRPDIMTDSSPKGLAGCTDIVIFLLFLQGPRVSLSNYIPTPNKPVLASMGMAHPLPPPCQDIYRTAMDIFHSSGDLRLSHTFTHQAISAGGPVADSASDSFIWCAAK